MTQPNIFEEDEVILLTGNEYKCGLVCSEFISSDEEDDNEFSEFRGLKKGTIAVAWHPEGNEEVVPESHVNTTIITSKSFKFKIIITERNLFFVSSIKLKTVILFN